MANTPSMGLRDAILSGEIAEVEKVLNSGANINAEIDDVAPLTFAIQNGEEDIAIHLIQAGANLSLDPLPNVSEQSKSAKNGDLNAVNITIFLIFCFESSLWDAACASILSSRLWPHPLQPILNSISAQTLFGFNMRGQVINICSALIWGNLSASLWICARFMPTYALMFLWTLTEKASGPRFDSTGGLWQLLQHCFQVGKWTLLNFGFLFVQEILYVCVSSTYMLFQGKPAKAKIACCGGSQAMEAILKYPGSSNKVASAIINSRVLPREYVICSIQPAMLSHDPLVLRIWNWALRNGFTEVVSRLMELGIPPTQARAGEDSPIGCSAHFGHVGLCECLIAALDPKDPSALEQIDRAFALSIVPDYSHHPRWKQKERSQIQSMLLARLGDVNVMDDNKRTGLSYAVSCDNLELVSHLLERGADVSTMDIRGRPPLSYLTNEENCRAICDRLLSAGADLDHEDDDGDTIMLRHAALSNTSALRVLLTAGADLHKTNRQGETCLQLAARYCVIDMMQLLIDEGADVEAGSLSSTPPLLQACKAHYDRWAGLKLLLENGADPNRVDSSGRAPLHRVCWQYSYDRFHERSDHLRSIEILIEHGANVNATFQEQRLDRNFAVSVIGVAAEHAMDRVGAIKALLSAGASPDGLDEEGQPVIVTACHYSPTVDGDSKGPDMVQLLLEAGADLHYRDELDRNLLHHASYSYSNNFLALKTLLTRGLDVNAKDIYGRTPLHNACQNDYWMTMDSYRTWEAAGMYGGSVQYASWHCSVESTLVIYSLLANEADTTADDCFQCTPAHIAAKAGNPRIMAMLLLQAGANQLYEFPDRCERLPFHYAVLSAETVRLLLHYHSTGEIFIDRYWSVEKQREKSLATLSNDIANGVWLKISRDKYQKAHPNEIIDDTSCPLPWRRGRCNAQDKYGNTPLHYAALVGNVEVVNQYVAMPDVDPAVRNNDGETPFDFSLENRNCALVLRARLLELGIEVFDTSSNTPIKSISKSRRAADKFVKALGRSHEYGVYPLDTQSCLRRKKKEEASHQGDQSSAPEL